MNFSDRHCDRRASTLSPIRHRCRGDCRSCRPRLRPASRWAGVEFSLADLLYARHLSRTPPRGRRHTPGRFHTGGERASDYRQRGLGSSRQTRPPLTKSRAPDASAPASLRLPVRIPERITIRRAGQRAPVPILNTRFFPDCARVHPSPHRRNWIVAPLDASRSTRLSNLLGPSGIPRSVPGMFGALRSFRRLCSVPGAGFTRK